MSNNRSRNIVEALRAIHGLIKLGFQTVTDDPTAINDILAPNFELLAINFDAAAELLLGLFESRDAAYEHCMAVGKPEFLLLIGEGYINRAYPQSVFHLVRYGFKTSKGHYRTALKFAPRGVAKEPAVATEDVGYDGARRGGRRNNDHPARRERYEQRTFAYNQPRHVASVPLSGVPISNSGVPARTKNVLLELAETFDDVLNMVEAEAVDDAELVKNND